MDKEHLYLVAYDIADPTRWRRVFRIMKGHGEWLQLSVFQCRLSRLHHAEMIRMLDEVIHHDQDHIVIMDMGLADRMKPKVTSLGKSYDVVEKGPVIV